jgi:predicted dehydrogenase
LDPQTLVGQRSKERLANRADQSERLVVDDSLRDGGGPLGGLDLELRPPPRQVAGGLRIGAVGAGFSMADVQLAAYAKAGFDIVAIASRTRSRAQEAADRWGIPTVHEGWRELLADERVELLDVALPPHCQPEIIEAAAASGHIRGILAQKPFALSLAEADRSVRACAAAGVALVVNQNMRFDQSMQALKTLLDRGYLGTPVVSQITMHACTYWQPFVRQYERTAILNMSVHHLDVFRHLFGDPVRVQASARSDPGLDFDHQDGIAIYVLEYADGLRAVGIDNCFSTVDQGVDWRVDGTAGVAKGRFGWTELPQSRPSTIDFYTQLVPGYWFQPRWTECWFPDAFEGPMRELMYAVETGGEPMCSGADNLKTMALVEAAYRSLSEKRVVDVEEVLTEKRR